MEDTNSIHTDDDIAAHPELALGRWAAIGLDVVVYSVSGAQASKIRGDGTGEIPCDEVFDRLGASIEVVGPVLPEEGTSSIAPFSDRIDG